MIPYLEKPEMDALLAAPNRQTPQVRRDYALLLFLYNSGTGLAKPRSCALATATSKLHP